MDSFGTGSSCSFSGCSGNSGNDYVTVHVDLWAGFEVHVVQVVHVIHVDLHWVEGGTGQREQPCFKRKLLVQMSNEIFIYLDTGYRKSHLIFWLTIM